MKRPLADDPLFIAGLSELDHGLDLDEEARAEGSPKPPSAAVAPSAVPPRRSAAARPEPRAFASDPMLGSAPRRRPLLDLFPPTTSAGDRPPGPLRGTAIGPRLPREIVERRRGADARRAAPQPVPGTYETFYGLREQPFAASTDPRFFFPSVEHERVAVELLTAIRNGDPCMLLTGERGMGKTTLCRAVLQHLDRRTVCSVVADRAPSIDDLLKTLLVDFGVVSRADLAGAPGVSRDGLAAALRSFLVSLAPLQAAAVVVVDDAEQQPVEVLGDLGVIAGDGQAAPLQIVLVGEPSFDARLREQPDLRAVNAAVTLRASLGPLAADDIAGYVRHRMAVAGTSPRVDFDEAAFGAIYARSRGVPRVVNLLCDRALTAGYERSASTIGADDLVDTPAAVPDVASPPAARAALGTAAAALAIAAFMLAGAVSALWVFRDAVGRTVTQWEDVPLPPGGPLLLHPAPLAPVPPPADALAPAPFPPP